MKCLWMCLSCILGTLAVLLILIFFFFLGCPYEFIKCYLEKKYEDHDDSFDGYEEDRYNEANNENEECTCGKISICILLAILGILCQPIYLLFYVLYGLMECYRRFGCWIFIATY
jgi:hypothetical protein